MRITTLGELAVDGNPVRGERLAAVVRALIDARGRTVTPAGLAEAVWGGTPPEDAPGAVHALIGRARRLGLPVAAAPGGYRVPAEAVELDTVLVKSRLGEARAALHGGRPGAATEPAGAARELFPAVPELDDPATAALFAEVAAVRAEAALALGEPADDADLRRLVERTPPHEPSAALLLRVLAAQGRHAEAIDVVERLRTALAEAYGTDPSPVVAETHLALLRGELGPAPDARPQAAEPVPTRAVRALPVAWRRAATPMLGREDDVAVVRTALQRAPLVTVVAAGGAGKTRLAAEVARRTVSDGTPVCVVELAGLRTGAEVLPALLAAADPAQRGEPGARTTAERLQEMTGLVVLDNCEHLLDGAAAVVADLVAAAPEATVLATSRAPLGLAGEAVHRLRPLSDAAAVELLTARAAAGGAILPDQPGKSRIEADLVLRLCHRLDNLPLALELAAARLRHMPIEDVLAGLDDRFGLLDDALRGLPERHAGLWAMVDWSRELLGPDERRLLERLAVIPAPFTAEAAERVTGLPRQRLAVLVEQSLLTLQQGDDGAARYRMLETVREYGEARLDAAGDRGAALDGLVAWARDEAVRLHTMIQGPGQLAAYARCAAEQDNFVAALRRAVGHDPAAAVDVAVALFHLWTVRGLHVEVVPWAAAALQADDPVARREGTLIRDADPDRLTWLGVLTALNAFAADAHRIFTIAARLLRRLAECRPGEASPRATALAWVVPALATLDFEGGLRSADRLIAHPDPYVRGFGHWMRGAIRDNRGEAATAQQRIADSELAYRAFEEAGDHWGMGMAAQAIGTQGGPGATEWLRRGAWHMEQLGAADDAGSILVQVDVQLALAGDDAAAERLREVIRSPRPARRGPLVMDTAQAHLGLAEHAWLRGRPGETVAEGELAAATADAVGRQWPQMRIVFAVAAAVLRLRATGSAGAGRATELLDGVWDEAISSMDIPVLGSWALGVAVLAAHRGEADAAGELWALGERCGANVIHLLSHDRDARLEQVLGGAEERAARLDAWLGRPMTEVTDRLRELADRQLHTFRR
ncbi:BTAD domain-containing putative transcriptional regulator [Dactylosporangium sp. CA-092794]|uniref:BTAD domain-containing putative transcriptional regulator n=1 Tax=Dactylosporangium sp. CA-092794 TaxID=3239929 RepID=UPI003D91A8F4